MISYRYTQQIPTYIRCIGGWLLRVPWQGYHPCLPMFMFGHSFCRDFRAGSSISSFGSSSPNGFCFGGAPAESCLRMRPRGTRPCGGEFRVFNGWKKNKWWELPLLGNGGNCGHRIWCLFRTLIQRECLVKMTLLICCYFGVISLDSWTYRANISPTSRLGYERGIRSINP